jgi:hypothetical protein
MEKRRHRRKFSSSFKAKVAIIILPQIRFFVNFGAGEGVPKMVKKLA